MDEDDRTAPIPELADLGACMGVTGDPDTFLEKLPTSSTTVRASASNEPRWTNGTPYA